MLMVQDWLCQGFLLQTKHLYFPSCKIVNADKINLSDSKFIFHLRSNIITPKFYPQDEILKGKAEFIFTLKSSAITYDAKNYLQEIFKTDIQNLKSVKSLKKTTLSLIAFYNPDADIKLDTLGIGCQSQICNLMMVENGKELARMCYWEYQLGAVAPTEQKRVKI